jgi:2-oxoglutarate ferredoxin oxidoreductase subunit alpha
VKKRKVLLMQGNEACAAGALAAGITFFAGYPITPATEIAEILSKELPLKGGKFIQMEDELACMGAVVGAGVNGGKAMTATSGPGFTLIQENLGYAAMTEIPCVVACVQRGGPSTGLPTLPSQGDVMQTRWGNHGDHPVIAFSPSSVRETFDLTVACFNYAEKYRMPVVLLTDAAIGHMREKTVLPDLDEIEIITRKRPTVSNDEYEPFLGEEDGVPPMADFGTGYRYYITGCVHNEKGSPNMQDPDVARKLLRRLHDKIENNRADIIKYEATNTEDAEVVVLAYGCVARSAKGAVEEARENGIKAGFFRPITMWPSPGLELVKAIPNASVVIVPEMNTGQYAGEISRILHDYGHTARVVRIEELGSVLIHPGKILQKIKEVVSYGE